jgi:hypothetical protein
MGGVRVCGVQVCVGCRWQGVLGATGTTDNRLLLKHLHLFGLNRGVHETLMFLQAQSWCVLVDGWQFCVCVSARVLTRASSTVATHLESLLGQQECCHQPIVSSPNNDHVSLAGRACCC